MEPHFWKYIFQGGIYLGTALVLISTIGINRCTRLIDKNESIEKARIEKERDSARLDLMKLTKFNTVRDSYLKNIHFVFILNEEYSAKDFKNFHAFFDITILNERYEVSTLDTNSNFIGYNIGVFHRSHKDPKKRNEPKNNMTFIPSNYREFFKVMDFNLYVNYMPQKGSPKIQDLQEGFIEIKVSDDLRNKVDSVKIIANDWIVFSKSKEEIRWNKETFLTDYIKSKGLDDINALLSDRTDIDSRAIELDFQKFIPIKIE